MSSAQETRAVLSKLDKVTRLLAYGHNGKVLVFVSEKDALDQDKVKEALKQTKKLTLRKMERA